jgi:hypothetical protein
MGYDPSWAMGFLNFDLPVVGRIDIPKTISFDFTKGMIGVAVGKVAPGIVHGLMSRFFANGEKYSKLFLGGLTGLALLSPKYRRNSYLMGFAIATVGDFIEPFVDGLLNMVMPRAAAPAAAAGARRRMGALSPQEAQALSMAETALLSGSRMGQGIPSGGFDGREMMLPSDYYALTQDYQGSMSGMNPSMVGTPQLRSIA